MSTDGWKSWELAPFFILHSPFTSPLRPSYLLTLSRNSHQSGVTGQIACFLRHNPGKPYFCMSVEKTPMKAPRLVDMMTLFRSQGPRGFEYGPRYYDAAKEKMQERRERLGMDLEAELSLDERKALMAERMKHSWHRESSDWQRVMRLMVAAVAVIAGLMVMLKRYDLLGQ